MRGAGRLQQATEGENNEEGWRIPLLLRVLGCSLTFFGLRLLGREVLPLITRIFTRLDAPQKRNFLSED